MQRKWIDHKLKVITLVMKELPSHTYEYKAIDDNGKVLATRVAHRTATSSTFIAALITKNSNHKWPYSMPKLFSVLYRITTTSQDKRCRPYAIAVLEEHKVAYNEYKAEFEANKSQQHANTSRCSA